MHEAEPIKFPGDRNPNPDENTSCQPPPMDNCPCAEATVMGIFIWFYDDRSNPRAVEMSTIAGIEKTGLKTTIIAAGERFKVVHPITQVIGVIRTLTTNIRNAEREAHGTQD